MLRTASPSSGPADRRPRRALESARVAGTPDPTLRLTRGRLRLLRAAVLGSASLLLALLAHSLGGHPLPGVDTALPLVGLAAVVALVATARRCRLAVLLPLLAAEQLLVHLLLSVGGAGDCTMPDPMPLGHAGLAVCPAMVEGTLLSSSAAGAMFLAHLVATALTAWLLTRGEAALYRLCDEVLRTALPALSSRPTVRRQLPVRAAVPALCGVALFEDATPRGPPVLAEPAR